MKYIIILIIFASCSNKTKTETSKWKYEAHGDFIVHYKDDVEIKIFSKYSDRSSDTIFFNPAGVILAKGAPLMVKVGGKTYAFKTAPIYNNEDEQAVVGTQISNNPFFVPLLLKEDSVELTFKSRSSDPEDILRVGTKAIIGVWCTDACYVTYRISTVGLKEAYRKMKK